MSRNDKPKVGTRIFKHGEGSKDPSHGMSKDKASKALKANSQGKKVDAAKVKAAKAKAKDHYAGEANKAQRSKWW